MSRTFRTFLALIVACTLASGVVAPAATGQIDPGELGELEARRDEIIAAISEVEALIADLELTVDDFEEQAGVARVQIELVADEIERAVHARSEPASTRVEIAIVGFTQGDPRQNALIDEVRTLEGDDEPSRRRVLYESVIDDTTERLAVVDARLTELAGVVDASRDALADTLTQLEETEAELQTVGALRAQLGVDLQDVLDRIEQLRALESRAVLTGLSTFEDPTRPALVVKIDNVPNAWPQAGINQADVVFVELVEGDLTRLGAVFHSGGAPVVGPVRSMRTGDFDLFAQFNGPLFSNSGGNRYTQGALGDSSLVDASINAAFDFYYRERNRRAPHNLMTNAYNLWSFGSALEGTATPSPLFRFRTAAEGLHPDARPVSTIAVDYGSATADYQWNGSGWDRTQDGVATVDTEGVRASPTTVIVHFTDYVASPADPRSPEAVTTGSGSAWVFTDGHVIEAVWRRSALTDQFEYVIGGSIVQILPGTTWIEMPRAGGATYS